MNENFTIPIHDQEAAFFQFLSQVLIHLPSYGSGTWNNQWQKNYGNYPVSDIVKYIENK